MKQSKVARFVATAKKPGHPCLTCRLPNRKAIDKDCLEFTKLRNAGTTHISWAQFTASHMRSEHSYSHNYRSLMNHMEKCLGQTLR
jgi:hypothetical protein